MIIPPLYPSPTIERISLGVIVAVGIVNGDLGDLEISHLVGRNGLYRTIGVGAYGIGCIVSGASIAVFLDGQAEPGIALFRIPNRQMSVLRRKRAGERVRSA